MFQKAHSRQAPLYPLLDVFFHFAAGVVAQAGMDMAINGYINQSRHGVPEGGGERGGAYKRRWSGISFGEKMEYPIDFGGVADIAHFHVEIKKSHEFVHFDGKSRAIREMVNQGVNFAQVNGVGKNSFHVGKSIQSKKKVPIS
jgi:hypothetical protein